MASKKPAKEQATLPFEVEDHAENASIVFRKLYYHLYTNSQTSRAERLVSDLSLLLLTKLAAEVNGGRVIDRFLSGAATADEALLTFLRRSYPKVVNDRDHFGMGDAALRDSFRI